MTAKKRDLLETLANDDITAFGYDKRQQRADDGDDEEDKRRKKRIVA